jgi:hypothetical protein
MEDHIDFGIIPGHKTLSYRVIGDVKEETKHI